MLSRKNIMGMPITVEIADEFVTKNIFTKVFDYFQYVDETFSVFKENSEISRINRREVAEKDWSHDMKEVFALAEKTKTETGGMFDITDNNGKYNPSGIVKGWAIYYATKLLHKLGCKNFYVNAGGDIQFSGKNAEYKPWSTGIKNPFNQQEIVKIVYLKEGQGIATSGNYIRGDHIWNPKDRNNPVKNTVSFTVIAPNVLEADRFATAMYVMGKDGITFLNNKKDFAGYMINEKGVAYMTDNFNEYI